ncbi:MAG: 3,4-dihydroxy-2-butanone-4-phosphate synthase [Myxococcales bacterium]|nr:3,4-dihydroxy-2-butanone-4-phosphate synthase [Myxococcales bacterium]
MRTEAIERVLAALDEIRAGRIVVLVDDEDRENEGDLVMAAQLVEPAHINFMATHARGLICLSLSEEHVTRLELPMMVDENHASRSTAFTVSIEARHGVTTGISAADRAHTVRTAVAADALPADLVRPGHVFPLRARPGGVLQRTGHTEGSVDLARLAGLDPSGVICEIMKDDGTMARYPDLVAFAEKHALKLISIADLVEYRLSRERLVRKIRETKATLPSGGEWRLIAYRVSVDARQFLALVHGEPSKGPALVRVHTGTLLGDVLGIRSERRANLDEAIARIEAEGQGVVLLLPGNGDFVSDLAVHMGEPRQPQEPVERGEVLREYGLGAQILADLGLGQIRLLTNRARRLPSLEGYGLEVVEQLLLREPAQDVEPEPAERTTH